MRASGWAGTGALALAAVVAGSEARADQPSAGALLRELEHLRVVGSVLYVAAHPDDENTRLLAYLAGERGLDVTYLSLTRGGGGQNLIGTEQGELLDVVRTDELLAARGIDGAGQRFTRARDFGYSKSADEALGIWGHEPVLDDVVRVVREVRPDVIVTRFGPDDDTHGHHVASAILAREAFEKAADMQYATDLAPWATDRLVRNESSWRMTPETDTSGWLSLDVGGYDPLLGRSWGEIAADSRTMHKSQGFGSAPSVGPSLEYFSAVAGAVPNPGQDLFTGLDLTWSRVPGGAKVDKALARAVKRFDPRAPHASLPDLAAAHAAIEALQPDVWRDRKLADLEAVMVACAGVHLTARSPEPAVAPGRAIEITLAALTRGGAPVTLGRVSSAVVQARGSDGWALDQVALEPRDVTLAPHAPWAHSFAWGVPADLAPGRPHWLTQPASEGRFVVTDPRMGTVAATPAALQVRFDLNIAGRELSVWRPVEYAWTDPVHGERVHPLEVLPPVTATFGQRARLVPAGASVTGTVTLRADAGPASGLLRLKAPEGGSVEPSEVPFALTSAAPEQVVRFTLTPGPAAGPLTAQIDRTPAVSRRQIDHPHLPRRTILTPAALQVVPVDLDRGPTTRIAYLQGSGDEVPAALRDLGYTVTEVDEDAILNGGLAGQNALVLGVRAYNTRPRLAEVQGPLMDWVAAGGRLIVQYNTSSSRTPLGAIGPAPLTIGRDRVTDEGAPLTVLDPAHPVLIGPNALTPADFDGWVQERGLYFAQSWDPAYTPVFEASDPGGEPSRGALLVAAHGEGAFVYTGLAFFRQLPAGVPGAARLFANLLAVEPGRE